MKKGFAVARLLISLTILAVGIGAVWYVSSGNELPFISVTTQDPDSMSASQQDTTPKDPSLSDYSWSELSSISSEISAAPTDEEGRKIAQSYGLVEADGSLTDDEIQIELTDGTVVSAQLIGIRHDDKSDGTGKAGLTFITMQAIAERPVNSNGDNAGGWESSELRAWLNGDALSLFSTDLREHLVCVEKYTNNVGGARDASAVTATSDYIWLPSAREVCGKINWFEHEYGDEYAYLDAVPNAEGEQYERFTKAGVTPSSDPNGVLTRTYQGADTSWSYRTPFFFVYQNLDGRYFYNVLATGYPYGYSTPDTAQGVVVGFCV